MVCSLCDRAAAVQVAVDARSAVINIRDNNFKLVARLKDARQQRLLLAAFARAERCGNSAQGLPPVTHKFDFEQRWLVNLQNGVCYPLSMAHTPIYRLQAQDLQEIRKMLNEQPR